MNRVEDFITATNGAQTQEEVFNLYRNALCDLGFDRAVYSLLTDHASINRPKGHGVMSNYPSDWMEYYMENNYFEMDPIPKYAFTTSKAYTWKQVVETTKLHKKQTLFMLEAEREAHLHDGVAVAIYGASNEVAGVGLASSSGGVNPDRNILSVVKALSHQFHIAHSEFELVQNLAPGILLSLTPREQEILTWVAEGKSNEDTATILGLAPRTVAFHMNNIFTRLEVTNRQMAVVKAIRYGLISPKLVKPVF